MLVTRGAKPWFIIIIIIIIIIVKQQKNKYNWKSSENRTQAENEKLFSVFCHCSVIRTMSLVINIIIIITIITNIVISI